MLIERFFRYVVILITLLIALDGSYIVLLSLPFLSYGLMSPIGNHGVILRYVRIKLEFLFFVAVTIRYHLLAKNYVNFKYINYKITDDSLLLSYVYLLIIFVIIYLLSYFVLANVKVDLKKVNIARISTVLVVLFVLLFVFNAGSKHSESNSLIANYFAKLFAADMLLVGFFAMYLRSERKVFLVLMFLASLLSLSTGSKSSLLILFFMYLFYSIYYQVKMSINTIILLLLIAIGIIPMLSLIFSVRFNIPYAVADGILRSKGMPLVAAQLSMRFNMLDGILLVLNSDKEFFFQGSLLLNTLNYILPISFGKDVEMIGQIVGTQFSVNTAGFAENTYAGALGFPAMLMVTLKSVKMGYFLFCAFSISVAYFFVKRFGVFGMLTFVESLTTLLLSGNVDTWLGLLFFKIIALYLLTMRFN